MRFFFFWLALASLSALSAQDEAGYFAEQAKQMAAQPYVNGTTPATDYAKSLTYDDVRNIRLKRGHEIFAQGPGLVRLLPKPAGSFNSRGVLLSVLESGQLKSVPADASLFEFLDGAPAPAKPEDFPGFSGFRAFGPVTLGGPSFEQFAFGGATYFRSHPVGGGYGLSARGLSVRAAGGKEEFPVFEQFALEAQPADSTKTSIHALMNSPSATGAFHIAVTPGEATVFEVRAVVYPRRDDVSFGFAAFSSMFWFAPNTLPKPPDYRPRVHDSEALAIAHRSSERTWRVLDVAKKQRQTSFSAQDLTGFGLIQRERKFEAYQDVTARYQKRTSVWVEPIGEWGPGSVQLREIPTDSEYDDNIVASWVPAAKPRVGETIRIAYRLLWCDAEPAADGLSRVIATSRGHPPRNRGDELMVVSFQGAAGPPPELEVKVGAGVEVLHSYVTPLPEGGGWQAHLGVRPKPDHPANMDLSLALKRDGRRISETWTYLWTPGPQ